MRIVLHVGPHKTGTTSIQTHLAALLREPVAGGYWYPPVPGGGLGPGHADLAQACLKEARPVAELDRVIATAQAAEVGTLVLSSEVFAHAFPARFARVKNVLEGYEIHLVVTLNEIVRRATSVWQELVKSGHVVGLEKGIEQILSGQPALHPHLTRAFIDALAPHETSVVLSHYRAPAAELLTNLCCAIGLFEAVPAAEAATRASTLLLNQSLGATEAEILRSVNSWVSQAVGDISKIPYNDIRDLYLNLFKTPIWRDSVPLRPITVPPPAHVAEILNRGRREFDDLRKLADEGRVRIFGDLDTMEVALAEGTPRHFENSAIASGGGIGPKGKRGGKANAMEPRLPPRAFFRAFSEATRRPVDFGDLHEPLAHFICKLDSYLSWKSWVDGITLAEAMKPVLHGSLLSYAHRMLRQGYFGRFGGTVSPCSYMLNFPATGASLLWIPKNSCTAVKKTLAQFEPEEKIAHLQDHLFHETCQAKFGVSTDDYARAEYFLPTLAVVRDPYERLASCYLDKFVNPVIGGTAFEGFIAAHIKHAHRTLRISGSSASLTFNQFVSYVFSAQPFLHDPHWRPQSNFFGADRSSYKIVPIEHISRILDLVGKTGAVSRANKSFGKKFTLERVGESQYGDLEPERFSEVAIADYADLFDADTLETVSTLYGEDVTLYSAAQSAFASEID